MKILYVFALFLLMSCFYSCYEDKGNYEYSDIFEIKVDSVLMDYTRMSLIDTLHIRPVITPADKDYEYFWSIYQTGVSGILPVKDTVATTLELHHPITLPTGSYVLEFVVREKETGICQFAEAMLTVSTPLTTGWYVARSQDGCTDLDLFSPTGKVEDVIAINNDGKKLKGEANVVDFSRYYRTWQEAESKYLATFTVFAASEEDFVAMRSDNGKIVRTFDDLFYETPAVANVQDFFYSGSSHNLYYLINDNKAHTISNMSTNSGRFGLPKSGDYKLSPFRAVGKNRDPILYDEKNCSFCTVTSGGSIIYFQDEGPVDSIPLPPVNDLNTDLLFMGPSRSNSAWALMKKRQEELYIMRQMNAENMNPYKNPTLECDTISGDLKLIQASKWASNLDNNIIYFVVDNVVYSCNIDADYEEKEQIILPGNEEVTYMQHLQFTNSSEPDKSFDHIAIATYDGQNYKVYLHDLQAGNLQVNSKVLEGTGRVGSVTYINDKLSVRKR